MKNKIATFLLSVIFMLGINPTVFAAPIIDNNNPIIDIVSIDGKIVSSKDPKNIVIGDKLENYTLQNRRKNIGVRWAYKWGDYIPNTLSYDSPHEYVDNSDWFHYTDLKVKKGMVATYHYNRSVTKEYEAGSEIEAGARAQGGAKFIAELEGHIDKTWTKSEKISIVKGDDSGIEIDGKIEDNVGTWKFYWYPVFKVYQLYYDWELKEPGDRDWRIEQRDVGKAIVPTAALSLDSISPND
ncbi:hypothetical protein CLTEP_22860 [Clostridium tepidiprofundi DSM 19306]|uniref:Uncharacterized protein n=1 Tax=Clostridium tepidiprofundi DSM 19306 TaxID=1121338 RepID=A0A151AWP0_9CLOT|nr:hypothetical protein [Clostridium tepidiprofundi]KYH32065.1 hypothetical protein CLTEP_22860 [Clostridium tepidiprofundi DSM 19306]